jgi:ATP-dependent RNA helicase RhlE
MGFSKFKLDQKILNNINKLGYKIPTSIQEQSILPILANEDVMGLAQTGTGKTAAFAIPILQKLLQGSHSVPRALIIAPTRELAQQIHDAITELCQGTGLSSITLYGGVNINTQIKNLKRGVTIIVACPGRLLDHIEQRTVDLSKLEVLVLDEADQMFDMGFLPSIRKILRHIPKHRQTLLFSATMPAAINELAHEVLHKPVTVRIGHSAPAKTVTQTLFPVAQHLKEALLIQILKKFNFDSVLIFTRTKHRAKKLAQKLVEAGYTATSLQGNLSQNKRQSAMEGFRDGSIQILVATDIASRGIDVLSISHVINYDIPATVEAYTHRIGRTGRAAQTGEAFTLITDEDASQVRSIEKVLGYKLERCKLENFNYDAAGPSQGSNLREHIAKAVSNPRHTHKLRKKNPKKIDAR